MTIINNHDFTNSKAFCIRYNLWFSHPFYRWRNWVPKKWMAWKTKPRFKSRVFLFKSHSLVTRANIFTTTITTLISFQRWKTGYMLIVLQRGSYFLHYTWDLFSFMFHKTHRLPLECTRIFTFQERGVVGLLIAEICV